MLIDDRKAHRVRRQVPMAHTSGTSLGQVPVFPCGARMTTRQPTTLAAAKTSGPMNGASNTCMNREGMRVPPIARILLLLGIKGVGKRRSLASQLKASQGIIGIAIPITVQGSLVHVARACPAP